jgi:hypothetical protein
VLRVVAVLHEAVGAELAVVADRGGGCDLAERSVVMSGSLIGSALRPPGPDRHDRQPIGARPER